MINTEAKRRAAAAAGLGLLTQPPASGSVTAEDRAHAAGAYGWTIPSSLAVTQDESAAFKPIAVLVDIDPTGTPSRWTNIPGGVCLGADWYAPRLLGLTPVSRVTQNPAGRFQSGVVRMTLDNSRGDVAAIDSDFSLAGKACTVRYGPTDGTYSKHFHGILDGKILGLTLSSDGTAEITIEEQVHPALLQIIDNVILDSDYPNLPDASGVSTFSNNQTHKNYVYGNVTRQSNSEGAVLAPYVDTVNRDCHAGAHIFKSIDQVYDSDWSSDSDDFPGNSGLLVLTTHYTIVETGGETLIRLNQAPHGPITFNANGITDDGTSGGTVLTNPADVLQDILERAGLAAGDMDSVSQAAVAAIMTTNSRTCKFVINEETRWIEALQRVAESFNIELPTFQMKAPDLAAGEPSVKIGFAYPQVASVTPSTPGFDDVRHLSSGSFREVPAEKVVTQYVYKYDRDWTERSFRETSTFTDTTTEAALGARRSETIELWAESSAADAQTSVQRRQTFERPSNKELRGEAAVSDNLDSQTGDVIVEPSVNMTLESQWKSAAVETQAAIEPITARSVEYDLMEGRIVVKARVYALLLATALWLGDGALVTNSFPSATEFEQAAYAYMTDTGVSTTSPAKKFIRAVAGASSGGVFRSGLSWWHQQHLSTMVMTTLSHNAQYVRSGKHIVRGALPSAGPFGGGGFGGSDAGYSFATAWVPGKIKVFLNGLRLDSSEYSENGTMEIVLDGVGFALDATDEVMVDFVKAV